MPVGGTDGPAEVAHGGSHPWGGFGVTKAPGTPHHGHRDVPWGVTAASPAPVSPFGGAVVPTGHPILQVGVVKR